MSLEDLTYESFQDELYVEMLFAEKNNSTDIFACDISISVDYTNKILEIEFDAGYVFEENNTEDSIIFSTTFARAPDRTIVSKLYVRCSSEDNCDENFLSIETYQQWWWLIDEVNYTGIYEMFDQLFDKDDLNSGTVQCYNDSDILQNCNSKICHVHNGDQYVNPKISCFPLLTKNLKLIIRTTFSNSSTTTNIYNHYIEYTCAFNGCNSKSIYQQIHNITNMYYKVSPMRGIFNDELTSIVSSTLTSTGSTTVSTTIRTTSVSVPTTVTSTFNSSSLSSKIQLKTSTILLLFISLLY